MSFAAPTRIPSASARGGNAAVALRRLKTSQDGQSGRPGSRLSDASPKEGWGFAASPTDGATAAPPPAPPAGDDVGARDLPTPGDDNMVTPPKPARVLPFSSPPECSAMLVVPTPSPTKTAAISVTGLEPGQLPPGSRVLLQDLAVKLQALSVAGGSDAASVGSPSEAFAFGLALGMAAASPARCKGALERMLTWIVVISALVVLACCALLLAGAAAATSEPAGRSFYS